MEQLTLDQQRIVSENHNLIYSLANKKNINLDEYYDVLAIGLCKAAIAFDNTKGKFSTLAYTVMLNEYKQELRKQQNERAIPQDKLLSFDVPIQTDQDSQFASFADETIQYLETEWQLVLFWIFWIALTGFAVYGFYYIDNRWLE